MSYEIIGQTLIEYITELEKYPKDERFLVFVWHGGEPLLLGIEFYTMALRLQKAINKSNYPIHNIIQTNGLLIDDEWLDFFKENNIYVGISLDGPKKVCDKYRFDKDKKSVFDKVMKAVNLLEKHEIDYSILSVVTDETCSFSNEMVGFFNRFPSLKYVDFLPGFYATKNKNYLNLKNYNEFLKEIYSNKKRKFKIRFFEDIESKLSKKKSDYSIGCEVGGACGTLHFVTKTGEVYPCVNLPIIEELRMGNIMEGLNACINSKKFIEFQKRYNDISKECKNCEVFNVCKAGCATRRNAVSKTGNNNLDFYCAARKNIIKEIAKTTN